MREAGNLNHLLQTLLSCERGNITRSGMNDLFWHINMNSNSVQINNIAEH